MWPNKPGILPDYAQVTVDFRDPDKSTTLSMEADMTAAIDDCCEQANVKAEVVQTWEFGNEVFDDGCIALVKSAADELQAAYPGSGSTRGRDDRVAG